ncbi:MAG: hypothetical protein AB8A40_06080 [Prochlorococcus sp.]|nr:hypothetical protein [Prochlorococcaceae cyanobacterium Fu_MAG_134]|tara:strand:+ start:3775 stop:4212 length:438 start_codon:yes stop_codon:yes gene_type:complete
MQALLNVLAVLLCQQSKHLDDSFLLFSLIPVSIDAMNDLPAFIDFARNTPEVLSELQGCSIEKWGDAHTPLDVDSKLVIEVARRHGYEISISDIYAAQCASLDKFWTDEIENGIVARRSLSRIQMNVFQCHSVVYPYSASRISIF